MTASERHTFVVLAHGDSPYLEECLDSLQHQTVRSRILISTSTPTERLHQISAQREIPLLLVSTPSTLANDWNQALAAARTSLVTLAHQDDIYAEDYVKSCLATIDKKDLILFTNAALIDENGNKKMSFANTMKRVLLIPMVICRRLHRPGLKQTVISLGNPINCPSVMYNLEMLSGFQFPEGWQYALDWMAWITLSKVEGSFVYNPQILLKRRIHKESLSAQYEKNQQRQREDTAVFHTLHKQWLADLLAKLYKNGYIYR